MSVITCIKANCTSKAFNIGFHGWLCFQHYREQQRQIPPAPRKPQPRWRGYVAPQTDDQIVKDIIQTDAAAIAAGKIVSVRFGVIEPDYIRYLEPVNVC